MASDMDFRSIMKIKKSSYELMKKAIFEATQNLGSGMTNAVPYDTAWVARVPKTDDLTKPAFPECLQWLRDHQREDGSWGATYPHSLHSDILNTFACVLALSQWNYPEDQERKRRAIEALTILAKKLPEIGTREKMFEMIISGLLDDAREFDLVIPYELFEWSSTIGKKELQEVEHKIMSNKPNKYWAILEATDRTLDLELESFRSEITKYGIIAAQPSTTAYILRFARLRGLNFPEAEWTLKKLCDQNQGGVPHFSKCDNFEIIYGLDFLFKAGINPRINVKHSVTENALATLKRRLDTNDGIGFCSDWQISDSESLLTALRVVHQTSKIKHNHEDGDKIDGPETTPAKKSKILIETELLKNKQVLLETNDFSEQTIDDNLKEVCSVEKAFLASKRNVSRYYNILQTVFDETQNVTEVIEVIKSSQNDDGGWGELRTSTEEETSYMCLAIYRLVQTQKDVVESINFSKLFNFMSNASISENECFWCYKVNFCSPNVANAAITAAKYAIFQIQRLRIMTDILNESQNLRFLASEPWNVNDEIINPGHFLLVNAETISEREIEVYKREVMQIFSAIFESEQNDLLLTALDSAVELSCWTYPVKLSPYDRAIDTSFAALLFVLDYIFDVFLPDKNNFSEEVDKLFSVLSTLLSGDTCADEVPMISFPNFSLIEKWCFTYRMVLEGKGWQADIFVRYLERKMFKAFSLSYELQRYGVDCSAKRFLQVHKLDIGNEEFNYTRSILAGKAAGIAEFEQSELFVKFIDCADKIGRLHGDVTTIAKDVRSSRSDNYCLKLRDEYKISLDEAAAKANRKCNRLIVKMLCLKKLILEDPKFKNNESLPFVLRLVEYGADGGLLWCLNSPRYGAKKKFTIARDLSDQKLNLLSVQKLCFD